MLRVFLPLNLAPKSPESKCLFTFFFWLIVLGSCCLNCSRILVDCCRLHWRERGKRGGVGWTDWWPCGTKEADHVVRKRDHDLAAVIRGGRADQFLALQWWRLLVFLGSCVNWWNRHRQVSCKKQLCPNLVHWNSITLQIDTGRKASYLCWELISLLLFSFMFRWNGKWPGENTPFLFCLNWKQECFPVAFGSLFMQSRKFCQCLCPYQTESFHLHKDHSKGSPGDFCIRATVL